MVALRAREAQAARIRWAVWRWMVKHNVDGAADKYAKAPTTTALGYGRVINALVDDIMKGETDGQQGV